MQPALCFDRISADWLGSGGFNEEKAKAIMLDELAKCDTLVAVKVVIYNR